MAKYINTLSQGATLQGKSYNYCLEKVLGQGSFGITYLASVKMQGTLGSIDAKVKVAVKEFFMKEINGREGTTVTSGSKGGLYADYRKKFIREATNLSKLQHPNIIKVLECFETNNTVYYTMEYLDGGSLDELINKKQGLPGAEAIKYIRQIAEALSYMHEHKVLHLDLKPGNIMLSNGNAVLIDFGLSKQYDASGNPESSTTVGAGTPGYAPIEQSSYRDGKGFPVTMDIYALGATMYKMLTGERPPDASEVLNDGLPDKPASVSSEVWAAVIAALEPMHKNRPQTVQEWKAILIDNNETAVDIVDVEIAKNKESQSDSNDNNESEEYHKGISAYEARDYQNAIKWFKIASCLNDGEACFMLFRMYDEGQGVAKNEDKAKGYLTKAAENHHPKALLKLGTYYEDAKYLDLAFEYFQHRVSQGDVESNFELAELYFYKNHRNDAVNCAKQLLDYILNQSEKEDSESLYRLFCLYGMLDDEDSADKYLLAAARKGHVESAERIGWKLVRSNETSKIEEGITWLSFAAEKGSHEAIEKLTNLYTINTSDINVDEDYNEALKWNEVGVSFGFIDCVYKIGDWLWDGLYVEEDKSKGFEYIKKAAEAGLYKAQKDLADIFLEDEDLADFEEAYKWYYKCAEHGDARCINKLGVMNVLAFGVPQNFSKARKLFEKAAEKKTDVGDGEAEYNLGVLFEYGYGVAINYSEAAKWYLRSCEHAHDNSHARKKLIRLQERGLYDGDIPHDSFIYPCGGLPHIPTGCFGDYIDTQSECDLEEHHLKIDTPKYVCSYRGGSFRKRFNKESSEDKNDQEPDEVCDSKENTRILEKLKRSYNVSLKELRRFWLAIILMYLNIALPFFYEANFLSDFLYGITQFVSFSTLVVVWFHIQRKNVSEKPFIENIKIFLSLFVVFAIIGAIIIFVTEIVSGMIESLFALETHHSIVSVVIRSLLSGTIFSAVLVIPETVTKKSENESGN